MPVDGDEAARLLLLEVGEDSPRPRYVTLGRAAALMALACAACLAVAAHSGESFATTVPSVPFLGVELDGGLASSSLYKVYSFKLDDPVAPFVAYTAKLSGFRVQAQPFRMSTAVCKKNVYVGWTAVVGWQGAKPVTEGRLTTLTESTPGAIDHLGTKKLSWCTEAGGLAVSMDCGVLGMLCRSKQSPGTRGATHDPLSAAYTKYSKPLGMYNDLPERNDHMYLAEYAPMHGLKQLNMVHVNAAIGGWEYGHWEVSMSKDTLQYFIGLKVTAGHHEGETSFALSRDTWKLVEAPRWGCGPGHIMANRVTYNAELGLWAEFCRADGTHSCADPHSALPTECGVGEGTFFSTYPGSSELAQLKGTYDREEGGSKGNGGPGVLISLGEKGWLGVGLGPAGPGLPVTVGLVKLPAKGEEYSRAEYPWMWLDLQGTDEDQEVEGSGIGYVNLQRIGDDDEDRFLLGYATGVRDGVVSGDYFTQEVTSSGCLLGAPQKALGGWGEDTVWTRLPSGCVATPYAWAKGAKLGTDHYAGGAYKRSDESDTMRVAVFCPAAAPKTCEEEDEVDECASGVDDCASEAVCTNLRNRAGASRKFWCVCPPGFSSPDDGRTCNKRTFASGVRFSRKKEDIAPESEANWWMWDVKDVHLYKDKGCSDKVHIDDGEPIGSAFFNGDDYFSPAAALGWHGKSGLFGGRVTPSNGEVIWMGMQWKEKEQVVRCVQLTQDNSLAARITFEALVGNDWVEVAVREAVHGQNKFVIPAHKEDGGGESTPQPSPVPAPPPAPAPAPEGGEEGGGKEGGKAAEILGVRIVRSVDGIGAESASWKWDVYSLRFYSDEKCSQELDVDSGDPIGSGWYGSASEHEKGNSWSPRGAMGWKGSGGFFGGRVDSSETIWVGEKWGKPKTIRCASFNMRHDGASEVTVELLHGDGEWKAIGKVFPTEAGDNTLVW